MSFLTAEWRKLAIANYVVDPQVLKPYIPAGTELDLWNGNCYVSLIGFLFKNTKLLGIRVPFHSNFEEVNLRFYVRYNDQGTWKRGAVFIKEIVPKVALTFIANTIYNENYVATAMKHSWNETDTTREVAYSWKCKGKWQHINMVAEKQPQQIPQGSEIEFITEHYWGYARCNAVKTNEYEVRHPRWEHYPVTSFTIITDFESNYGSRFAFLNQQQSASVMLIEGSAISVEGKTVLRINP